MSLNEFENLGLRQTICLALPKIFCTTFKSISKFYAFGFLKFNQISVRYFEMIFRVFKQN